MRKRLNIIIELLKLKKRKTFKTYLGAYNNISVIFLNFNTYEKSIKYLNYALDEANIDYNAGNL